MVEHGETASAAPRGGPVLRRRYLLALVALLVAVGVTAGLLIGSPSAAKPRSYEGLTLTQPKAAPPLALDNYLGTPVNIASYRGKAVLVTFLYTHCPDVCPLIASKLHTAWTQMPAAERAQVEMIAVSVDPRGDTPATVARFLADHRVTGEMQYLIGSRAALGRVWVDWGIASSADQTNPALIDHTALIYGITAAGMIKVIYPSNFAPSEVVNDVPLLAGT